MIPRCIRVICQRETVCSRKADGFPSGFGFLQLAGKRKSQSKIKETNRLLRDWFVLSILPSAKIKYGILKLHRDKDEGAHHPCQMNDISRRAIAHLKPKTVHWILASNRHMNPRLRLHHILRFVCCVGRHLEHIVPTNKPCPQ